MSYITPAELAERPGARELAQLASSDTQPVKDYALMDATLRGTSRAAWTPEQIAAADAALARINDAIAEAGGVIDGYVAQRGYTLPLTLPPTSTGKSVLAAWARAITRYLLNKNRITDETKDPVARDYRDALKMLGLLAQGKYSLGANDPARDESISSSTDVRFAGDPTVFGRDQLSRFR
jgi:phage gp36-like protein